MGPGRRLQAESLGPDEEGGGKGGGIKPFQGLAQLLWRSWWSPFCLGLLRETKDTAPLAVLGVGAWQACEGVLGALPSPRLGPGATATQPKPSNAYLTSDPETQLGSQGLPSGAFFFFFKKI